MVVKSGKYFFTTTALEINRNKYDSCKIHYCTTCPTFGSTLVKNIIKSCIHLRIIWTMKVVELIVGDVGEDVQKRSHRYEYAYFCSRDVFLH